MMKSKTIFHLKTHANGTKTLVDSENEQAMHSRIGPESEAQIVYAERARIEERLDSPRTEKILYDVGMGTGANVLAVLERISARKESQGTLRVFSFELKPEGLEAALAVVADFPLLARWEEKLRVLLTKGLSPFWIGEVEVIWTLLTGDFYSRLKECPPAHFVFFDFYSPKVVPELWSRENFTTLRNHLGEKSTALFTYSAATPVRLNLLLSGFFVGEGISTGMKNETTIAHTYLAELENPLTRDWLKKLDTSTSIRNVVDKDSVRSHPQWKT